MNQTDLIRELQFQNKVYRDQIEAFRSGSKLTQLRKDYESVCRNLERQISDRDRKITWLYARLNASAKKWMDVNDDVIKEKDAAIAKMQKEVERAKSSEQRAKDEVIRLREENRRLKENLAQVEKERDTAQTKTRKLEIKANKNFQNSSLPSSHDPNHETVVNNSREKTDRRPGGQPGHEHHPRPWNEPTSIVSVPSEAKHLDTSRYKPTGKVVKKQLISVDFVVKITEYEAIEYVDLKTGQRVHAKFPKGLKDDVTYDGTVEAFAYLLNNELYSSIDKTTKLISDITDGRLKLSKGMVANLSKRFSNMTKDERKKIFEEIHSSDVVHADFTFGRVDGKQGTVLTLVDAETGTTMLLQKPAKGAKGVADSPLVGYQGTTVTDHERILIKQGTREQECLSHVSRYAKGSAENEPSKKCFAQLGNWITESVGYWDDIHAGVREPDEKYASDLRSRLVQISQLGMEEYEKEPAPSYYKDGFNLIKRIAGKPEDYFLFLNDYSVPPTNNRAEAAARKVKRKFRQVMAFRSDKGLAYFCNGQTMIQTMKHQEGNLFAKVGEVFNTKRGAEIRPVYVYVEKEEKMQSGEEVKKKVKKKVKIEIT